jgi:hypothetical protein
VPEFAEEKIPPPETVATILVPSAEQAMPDHAFVGAEVKVQFWPKVEATPK